MSTSIKTPETYAASKGARCPVCNSDELEAGEMEIPDYGTTYQPVKCNGCGASWNDKYTITGYENLELGVKG